jgi:hypothetical protein
MLEDSSPDLGFFLVDNLILHMQVTLENLVLQKRRGGVVEHLQAGVKHQGHVTERLFDQGRTVTTEEVKE